MSEIIFPGVKEGKIPTPHIAAKKGDFAKTVLLPGDPSRAKYIAETFFENKKLVNNVRGAQGYTGTYKGVPVSVMGSGMGISAIGIYSYELFNFYDVDNIIRVGTVGAMQKNVNIRDIVVALSCHTDSDYQSNYNLHGHVSCPASYDLVKRTDQAGELLGLKNKMHFGSILSTECYYCDSTNVMDWAKLGTLAVEMEGSALYMTAARAGKNGLSLCTVSNNLITGDSTSPEERESSFSDMAKIALEVAVSYAKDHP